MLFGFKRHALFVETNGEDYQTKWTDWLTGSWWSNPDALKNNWLCCPFFTRRNLKYNTQVLFIPFKENDFGTIYMNVAFAPSSTSTWNEWINLCEENKKMGKIQAIKIYEKYTNPTVYLQDPPRHTSSNELLFSDFFIVSTILNQSNAWWKIFFHNCVHTYKSWWWK